jgi:hypothetical protein
VKHWDEVRAIRAQGTPQKPVAAPAWLLADGIRAAGIPDDLREYVAWWIDAAEPPRRPGRPRRPFTGAPNEATLFAHWNKVHTIACRVAVLHAAYRVRAPRGSSARELAIADAAKDYNNSAEYVRQLLKDVKSLPAEWRDSIPTWQQLVRAHRNGEAKLPGVKTPRIGEHA